MAFDFKARYRVKGFGGVAFRAVEFPKVWEPYLTLVNCRDSHDECWPVLDECPGHECDMGEGEWVDGWEELGKVVCIMVGDDRRWTFDIDTLEPLKDSEYCHECGQIGCAHGAYPEDE